MVGKWAAGAGVGLLAVVVCLGLKLQGDYSRLSSLPQPGDLSLSTVVLDREDRLLRAFTSGDDKWRLPIKLEDIDPLYFDMLLAFEDKRYFEHGGVDPRALLRSVVQSAREGRLVSGGSTLTMQVARLLEERSTRSLDRKYQQMLKAVQLERTFSKEDILRFYVLRAPFGGNLEGVRAASLTWFGKEPKRLTPAEAALLVALPQSPEARRPDRYAENARMARNRVLRRAVEEGVLTEEAAHSAAAEPVRARRFAMPLHAPHETRRAHLLQPEMAVHHLTIDRGLQSAVETLAGRWAAARTDKVSMAIVVADHQNGDVLASLGSPDLLDTGRQGHVDMTRAVRSPGSTLKPFIYGLAFEEGIGFPGSLINDRPTSIGGYQPVNFDQSYQGMVTLSEALQLSLNTPAVQLLEAVGPARLIARLKRAGVTPVMKNGSAPGLAIGLGGLGLSLRDLAQAYAALARHGRPIALQTCRRQCAESDAAGDGKRRLAVPVLSSRSAYWVGDILQGLPQVRSMQTGHIAYKTGTAYGYRDAWAVGYDGRFVVAVWTGRPDGTPVPGQTGALSAVPVLFDVFQKTGPERAPFAEPAEYSAPVSGMLIPKPLRFARVSGRPGPSAASRKLSIAFPPDGSVLDLGIKGREGDRANALPVVVKIRGGKRPYRVLVNGAPWQVAPGATQLVWQADSAGFADITVIDALGAAATVAVELQ